MVTEDIEFIKTSKEGSDLQVIKDNYPNSIINVNSNKEKNIYIGKERITDNYNLGVDENSITNNVGGMVSGINASELKGKSVSEILDIILFASNNNLTLKGVMVVDKIGNLTDNTLEDVYQGMVVSVIEDNSLYILLTEPDEKREWKKVGLDIDIEELKINTKKLSAPITVAGLSGSLGANISNGKIYTTDNTIEDVLRDLLCKEIYPNVSLYTVNPVLSFGGMIGATASNYSSIMEVGSILNLNPITLNIASISNGYRRGSGFTHGYSIDGYKKESNENPPEIYAITSLDGLYSLTETYTPSYIGTTRTVEPSDNIENVKFDNGNVVVGLGNNVISFSAISPKGKYTHPEYPEYYVVSNLGNLNVDEKLQKSDVVNKTINPIIDSKDILVVGVYPVYVNISSGSLVDEPIKMSLTTSNVFEFEVPSEVSSGFYFTFDYPSTHNIISFEIKDLTGKFVNYDATYEKELKTLNKDVCGNEILYKRLQTTGKRQGEGTYRITLSKGLDE